MKHRIMALSLALILCAVALLIGPHLVFHEGSHNHEVSCIVCRYLMQNEDVFVCLLAAFAGMGLLGSTGMFFRWAALKNRIVPDWTPVRLKVKLLD